MKTLLIPRWSGSPATDWYPRALQLELIDEVLAMPDPDLPRPVAWTQTIIEHLHTLQWLPQETRIVTHSVACHALMMAIDQMSLSTPIAQVTMVAGWWTIDRQFWNNIGMNLADLEPWMNYKLDFAKVRSAIYYWHVIIGTEDALSPDYQHNLRQWLDVGVDAVSVLPNGKHFNQKNEDTLFKLLGRKK